MKNRKAAFLIFSWHELLVWPSKARCRMCIMSILAETARLRDAERFAKEDTMSCCRVNISVRLNKAGGKTWTIKHTCGKSNETRNGG